MRNFSLTCHRKTDTFQKSLQNWALRRNSWSLAGHGHLRIYFRTRSSYDRLGMTTAATVEIERWAEAVIRSGKPLIAPDGVDSLELKAAGVEECQLHRAESQQRASCSPGTATHPRVLGDIGDVEGFGIQP
jgi:hypothetical protein